jgi:uncharacterized protein (TIGR02996 family)
MPTTEESLLAGIVAHPGEVERWCVLADWLEEQGDPRAELARLRFLLHAEPDHPERAHRQLALVESGLAPVVPTWTNALGVRFALILPGTFWMGSPASEPERRHDEVRHRVTLTEPFFLAISPVTVRDFEEFVSATGHRTQADADGDSITWRNPGFEQDGPHPVVCVSWSDATAMIEWLNESDPGRAYALPTEAQWEYACRAGSESAYFWGDDPGRLEDYAWFSDNAGNATHPIYTKQPNPWGLRHMSGHVWEWCGDYYGNYATAPVQNPRGQPTGHLLIPGPGRSDLVLRGGGWGSTPRSCRSATRSNRPAIESRPDTGFRLVARLAT